MPLKGIDVSASNGVIDWDKVKDDGVDFAMIRLGFGSDIESQDDEQFERNVKEAERVGIPWGSYLYSYALNVESAKSEKEHALRLLDGKKPAYPIAFDMEDADHYKSKHGMPSDEVLVDICDTFLSGLEEEGFEVRLYASLYWLNNQLNSPKLDIYRKWVAQWSSRCTYDKPFDMWQYADNGKVDGISGSVDLDYSYHDFTKDQPVEESRVETKQENKDTYTIEKGDTLWDLENKWGLSHGSIAHLNPGIDADHLSIGQKIIVPSDIRPETKKETTHKASGGTYTVKHGDTLWGIAKDHNTSVNELKKANHQLKDPDVIHPGETIHLPGESAPKHEYHTVQKGDTAWDIAKANNTTVDHLGKLNPSVKDLGKIYPGQKIRVK